MTREQRQPTISACLIVKNESAVIGRCLQSLSSAVDEIVVVDTGSTDDTPAIAARLGARVRTHAWTGDFADARNAALEAATSDWILTIDADEYLEPQDRRLVRAAVAGSEADGIWVTLRNTLPQGDLIRFVDSRIVRLFRRHADVRYRGLIHEEVQTDIERRHGRVEGSRIVIQHDGYARDAAQGGGPRAARNLEILLRAAALSPLDPYLQFHLGATYQHLGRAADARRHLQQVFRLPHEALNVEVQAGAAVRLAQLALADRRYGSVVHYAGMAIAIDAVHVLAHYLAGLALMWLARPAEAVPHLALVKASGQAAAATEDELARLLAFCASAAEAARGAA